METPGANAANILFEATKEDNPNPSISDFPEMTSEQNSSFWKFSSKDSPIVCLEYEESARDFCFFISKH